MKSINPSKRNVPFAGYSADAMLLTEFERSVESGRSFNYSRSVASAPQPVPGEQITAYLTKIQRGGLIQSFGCMLAIEEPSFRILAYSENAIDFLDVETDTEEESKQLKGLLGVDARTLFTPSSGPSLAKAVASRELSLLNPIWVESRSSQKPFYAIVHRIDVGMVIDLEPVPSDDPALSLVGAVQSQKLAVRAISRLQSLPAGDVGALFDAVVEDVQKLTGYDRVMVYKFHDDDHGEVVSEIRRSDLEPYLGLHYPATDVPQAARFLFKQNLVRMICDCNSSPVRVIQSEELKQPLGLVNSTLRSPHACYTQFMSNMGSIASLAMAVVISANDLTRLWGLVVCHNTSPRYVPFPLRYACEFLMRAFGLQLYLELQLISQMEEKNILRMQTMLCDMLLRDVPSGIVTQSPNIMDLVKCDGAALLYGGRCWLVGITPTEAQVKDIAAWLLQFHEDSTGLSTDCLSDAGYLRAALLGDAVCGMATARITSKDFLFWFRSHTAKEVRWGGAKHHPEDKDDDGRMNPRSSFKAFLEVVKGRSLPWEDSELNAIHSLQLILRGSFQGIEDRKRVEALIHAQKNDVEMKGLDELGSAAYELARMIETATVPILAVDLAGLINGWNSKTAELTGLHAKEALGKSLVKDIVHEDSCQAIENHLLRALQGEEHRNVELKLRTFGLQQQNPAIFVAANACTSRDYTNRVVGVCFVGQDVTEEKVCMDKFIRLQGDYKAMVQSVNPLIPPIFALDENSCCSEWNAMMEKLTGWTRKEVIGKMILGEVFGGLCKLKDKDTLVKFMILLYRAIGGHDTENFPLVFFDREGKYVEVLLTANRRTDIGGNVIGCFCFLRTVVPNLQSAVEGRKEEEKKYFAKLKELVYIQQEAKNPLNGILFAHKLLENTTVTEDQKQFLDTIYACERQMARVLEDMEFGRIEGGCLELNMVEFNLGSVIDAIISQAMILLREKHLQLILQIPEEIKTLTLYGDEIRLQQVLSDFLLNIVHYTPTSDGWAEIMVAPGLKLMQDGIEFIHLQFRMTHPGHGLPSALVQDMFEVGTQLVVQESFGLNLSRKLLNKMNGNIQYVREPDKCYFVIDLKLQTKQNARC